MMLYLRSLTDNVSVEWLYAVFAAVACYVLVLNARNFAIKRLERLVHHAPRRVHPILVEVARRTHRATIFVMSLLIGVAILNVESQWAGRIHQLWFIVIGFQIAAWINCGVSYWSAARLQGAKASAAQNGPHGHPEHNPVITTMLSWLLRVLLWSMLLLAVLSNLGVDITAFVASLGVGGIAVALAVQSILSDVFASAAIGLDKPFELGDFIVFGDVAGSIEQIGLKTTRIRSLSGEEIVCSNTELLKNTIHNYKRMQERRILFAFQLPFDTPVDLLTALPDLIRQAVETAGALAADQAEAQTPGAAGTAHERTQEAKQERTQGTTQEATHEAKHETAHDKSLEATFDGAVETALSVTRFDRAHLKSFTHSGLEFEVVYYVTDAAYGVYMDVQQAINVALLRAFAQRGIRFAFPSRTVHLARDVADANANANAAHAERDADVDARADALAHLQTATTVARSGNFATPT